jgi:hypothetical protein
MWRVGPRPPPGATKYAELNAEPVVPEVRALVPRLMPTDERLRSNFAPRSRRRFRSGRRRWTSGAIT